MALAYSYRRVSSGGQAHSDKSGLQRQEQALKDWMRRHPDYQLAEELLDQGVSAYTGQNRIKGALGRFLASARSGSIPKGSVLVVEESQTLLQARASGCIGVSDPGCLGVRALGLRSVATRRAPLCSRRQLEPRIWRCWRFCSRRPMPKAMRSRYGL